MTLQYFPMYRQNYIKADSAAQTLDFSSLRKNSNVVHAKTQNNVLLLQTQPNVALLLLAGFTLFTQQIPITDSEFLQFNFDQVPKNFQQFQHEKTINEILNVIKGKVKNIDNFCQFFNYYPVSGFVLECWARQRAKTWLQANPADAMGNQNQLLQDLSAQLRGPLLGAIASCFGVVLKIKYDISSKNYLQVDLSEFEQEYGDLSSKLQLAIEYRSDGFSSGKLSERESQASISLTNASKTSECGYLRRSKVIDNEIEPRSGAEYKSLKKERGVACEKCGNSRKCQCNTIKRKGLGVTPKSNPLSNSSSTGFKNDPFNLGFLNANNISKIRDANKQK